MQLNLRQRLHSIRSDNTPVERAYGESMRQKAGLDGGHSGARFHCPICSRWYRRFAPFGLRGRPNARCPGCGSLERHRFLWLYLRDTLNVHRRFRSILHVAPEACLRESLTGISGVRYLAIDRYDDDAQADQQDLTDLPYAADTFDLIICNHVLEHIADDRKALAEIARVLTPRGRALLMVPIDRNRQKTYEDPAIISPSARLEAFGHPYHVRICGWDYAERIRESRFDVLEAHSTALAPHHRRINRINKTVLYDCTIAP